MGIRMNPLIHVAHAHGLAVGIYIATLCIGFDIDFGNQTIPCACIASAIFKKPATLAPKT